MSRTQQPASWVRIMARRVAIVALVGIGIALAVPVASCHTRPGQLRRRTPR